MRPGAFLNFSRALVDTVHCFGEENRLFDCNLSDIGGIIECGSPEVYTGVRCDGELKEILYTLKAPHRNDR